MARPQHRLVITLNAEPAVVFDSVQDAMVACGWELDEVDAQRGTVTATVGGSFASRGQQVRAECAMGSVFSPGNVVVTIVSESRGRPMLDWGVNQQNCDVFEAELLYLLDGPDDADGDPDVIAGDDETRHHRRVLHVAPEPRVVFGLIQQAIRNCGWELEQVDETHGSVVATVAASLTSHGHSVRVHCALDDDPHPTSLTVTIASESWNLHRHDEGANERNCDFLEFEFVQLLDEAGIDVDEQDVEAGAPLTVVTY